MRPDSLPQPHAHFAFDRLLGRGGMGEVWEATSPRYADTSLAIKFLAPGSSQTLFRNEATTSFTFSHPYAVQTVEYLDFRPYVDAQWRDRRWSQAAIVMVREPGSLEREFQRARPMPWDQAVRLAGHLSLVISELHAAGYVHRDIKAGNVLLRFPPGRLQHEPLDGRTEPVLADLGVAWSVNTPVSPEVQLGDDGWKAPEVLRQDTRYLSDPAQDIWAFGKLLNLLAARVPHQHRLLPRLIALADWCQQPDPRLRPRSVELFDRVYEATLGDPDLIARVPHHPRVVMDEVPVELLTGFIAIDAARGPDWRRPLFDEVNRACHDAFVIARNAGLKPVNPEPWQLNFDAVGTTWTGANQFWPRAFYHACWDSTQLLYALVVTVTEDDLIAVGGLIDARAAALARQGLLQRLQAGLVRWEDNGPGQSY